MVHVVHLIEINDNNDQPLASAMNQMQLTKVAASNKSNTSSKSFIFFKYTHFHLKEI